MELKELVKLIKELTEYLFEYDEMREQINKLIDEGRLSVTVGELILRLLDENCGSARTMAAKLDLIGTYLETIE